MMLCCKEPTNLDIIRPRNINRQDQKYTSFVVFICHSQKHSTSQFNGRSLTCAMCRDDLVADIVENIGLSLFKVEFQSTCVYTINREKNCRINFLNKMQIDARH